jgi:predicted dehydrogenase
MMERMALGWLVVGIGDISTKRVLPAILASRHSRLAGIVTRDPAKAAPYGVPSWESLEAALAACPAEAVYIATPVFVHAAQTIAALRAGRHVLCEKPMAMDYQQAVTIEQAAEETGRTLGIAYYRRMYPKVERARELLAAGAIGRPVFAEATAHDWFYPAGAARDWLLDPAKAGGGPLYDIACHRIDLMNYLFGRPMRATGYRSTLVHRIAVEDNATVLTEHDSGVRGMVDVRWHSRVARDEFRIRGTDGEMDLTPLNSPALVYPGGTEEVPAPANLHYPCVEDFACAILEGRPPRSSGATALETEWVMAQVQAKS